ncbi:MAG TPA: pitrilysin family protein [Vicinamibacteria bacterium]|nr:pitrilysin family protein [Vicinamibacteria bacterium]
MPLLALALPAPALAGPAPAPAGWAIPVETKTLPNGLTVVVSEDHSSPTFGISIAYRIGFRLEPKGRTGFAHLFEHMMFEGTPVAPKGTLTRVIEGGGGVLNGSTRYDYTNYIASAPVSALDAILWLEADRMKHLDFSEKNLRNQQEVVKEEIRVNVKNRPYGLFFWTDLAAKTFDKWENGHDGYGSFEDLDAAHLGDVESFFGSYYGPNNAVLSIVGDVVPAEVFAKVEKYFGALVSRPVPPGSDVSEALNTAERTLEQTDPLARVPAVAVGFKIPTRSGRDYVPLVVLGDVLLNGEASRLYQALVKGRELMLQVQGGVNFPFESPWRTQGPTLLGLFGLYKPTTSAKAVVDAIQEEVRTIARAGVPAADLARVKAKMRSDFYSELELPIYRADALAVAQLLGGSAASLNDLPAQIDAVSSADLRRVAATYLTVANRTVVDRKPAPPPAEAKGD